MDQDESGRKRTKLRWEYYEKPMVSRYIVREEGALPTRMKLTVLAQEVIRRERNTSRKVDRETRVRIRNRFLMKLKLSGFDFHSLGKRSNQIAMFCFGYSGMILVLTKS